MTSITYSEYVLEVTEDDCCPIMNLILIERPGNVRHTEIETAAFVNNENLDKGTVYIAESRLCWIKDNGIGFSIEYPSITVHAVSRNQSTHPSDFLYIVLDVVLNADRGNSGDAAVPGFTEIRFAPSNKDSCGLVKNIPSIVGGWMALARECSQKHFFVWTNITPIFQWIDIYLKVQIQINLVYVTKVQSMFQAMNVCQRLHPDNEDEECEDEQEEVTDDSDLDLMPEADQVIYQRVTSSDVSVGVISHSDVDMDRIETAVGQMMNNHKNEEHMETGLEDDNDQFDDAECDL